jgi:phage-related tail protein
MNVSNAMSNRAISSIASSNVQMMQVVENAQKASTELAEKMLKVSAAQSSVVAEMTGIGMVVDMYV